MGANLSYTAVDLAGRVVIVTGSNTGVGYETAKAMANMGAKVVMACRSQDRAEQAIEKMKRELPEATLDLEFAKLDLASLKSTASFADAFLNKHDKLNILCCNAGFVGNDYRITEDGLESMFQANYLSHFLLMTRLLPLLKASNPDPRIVSVSSRAHGSGVFDLASTNNPSAFGRMRSYGTSKLLQVMLTGALQRRLEGSGVTVSSLHPGVVKTEFDRNSSAFKAFYTVGYGIGAIRNPAEGAATTIYACVNPELEGQPGMYFDSCKPSTPSGTASNQEKQDQLFEYSVGLLKDLISEDGARILGIDLASVKSPEFGLPVAPPDEAATGTTPVAATSAAAAATPDVDVGSHEGAPPLETAVASAAAEDEAPSAEPVNTDTNAGSSAAEDIPAVAQEIPAVVEEVQAVAEEIPAAEEPVSAETAAAAGTGDDAEPGENKTAEDPVASGSKEEDEGKE